MRNSGQVAWFHLSQTLVMLDLGAGCLIVCGGRVRRTLSYSLIDQNYNLSCFWNLVLEESQSSSLPKV